MSEEEATRDLHALWVPNEVWQKFINDVLQRYR